MYSMIFTRFLGLLKICLALCVGMILATPTAYPSLIRSSQNSIVTIAGTGAASSTGTGGVATAMTLNNPQGIWLSSMGTVYVVEYGGDCVRKFSYPNGIVFSVAGVPGLTGSSGDNGPATSARLTFPYGIVVDTLGVVYIADWFNMKVRMVSVSGIVTSISGTGTNSNTGDNGPASSATISGPLGLWMDTLYQLYVMTYSGHTVRRIGSDVNRIITAIAGTGTAAFSGDGGPATSSTLNYPNCVFVDSLGVFYIGDQNNNRVRRVATGGIINTVIGPGNLNNPKGVVVDPSNGDIYVSSVGNYLVKVLTASSGIVTDFAGNQNNTYSGESVAATSAGMRPCFLFLDTNGRLFITDNNSRVRMTYSTSPTTMPTSRPSTVRQSGSNIYTVAGFGDSSSSGTGGAASAASLNHPLAVWQSSSGIVYFGELNSNCARGYSYPSGVVFGVAGVCGGSGFSGDNGQATAALFSGVSGVNGNTAGVIYIADQTNNRVRMVSTSGIVITLMGDGSASDTAENAGAATSASINHPDGLWLDSLGQVYVTSTGSSLVRKITTTLIVQVVAGTGSSTLGGDGFAATAASLNTPEGVFVDSNGWVYICDSSNHRVRFVDSNSIISTIAGTGSTTYGSELTPATATNLNYPFGAAVDTSNGDLYVTSDGNNRVVVMTRTTGIVSTYAGTGSANYTADGVAATSSAINGPTGLWLSTDAMLFVADCNNNRIRVVFTPAPSVAPTVVPTTSAPSVLPTLTPTVLLTVMPSYKPTVIPTATPSVLPSLIPSLKPSVVPTTVMPTLVPTTSAPSVSFMPSVSPTTAAPSTIRSSQNFITTIAGTGAASSTGTGGVATAITLYNPYGIWLSSMGTVYVVEYGGDCVRKFSYPNGIVFSVGGVSGSGGSSGDNGPATSALLNGPYGIVVDTLGVVYIADTSNHNVRMVSVSGTISTIAGTGISSNTGDNGPASSAALYYPRGVWMDSHYELYVVSNGGHTVRRIGSDVNRIISTIAGTGTMSFSGDGGPATSATLFYPISVFVDSVGVVYIGDTSNNRVRRVTTGGIISTVIGTGYTNYNGNQPVTSCNLNNPWGVVVDPSNGDIYVASINNYLVQVMTASSGMVTVFAGNQNSAYSGESVSAVSAGVKPYFLFLDTNSRLFISDSSNNRVRMTYPTSPTMIPTTCYPTLIPSPLPSLIPSYLPCLSPSCTPSVVPSTLAPSVLPSVCPSISPSLTPSVSPSVTPSVTPSATSAGPSVVPTVLPSLCPSLSLSLSPSVRPSVTPSVSPSVSPTISPSWTPSLSPSVGPSVTPSVMPSVSPSVSPTISPSWTPSLSPSVGPSVTTSVMPSVSPSISPSILEPSEVPSEIPTTEVPSMRATAFPSLRPSIVPSTALPSLSPTQTSSVSPSLIPSLVPITVVPTTLPSMGPSVSPSLIPSMCPTTQLPSKLPSVLPTATDNPSTDPSVVPSSIKPSVCPSVPPSVEPTVGSSLGPSVVPTVTPSSVSVSLDPSVAPSIRSSTVIPSEQPTQEPSMGPSFSPSDQPSIVPSSFVPSHHPTVFPSEMPSALPSAEPSLIPSMLPSLRPSIIPSELPSPSPSLTPSMFPTLQPSVTPSLVPTVGPSLIPTLKPTACPSVLPTLVSKAPSITREPTSPTVIPSINPGIKPTQLPSLIPSCKPSQFPVPAPTVKPTRDPTIAPSLKPTRLPSTKPSAIPSVKPSLRPTRQPTTPTVTPTLPQPSISPSPTVLPTVSDEPTESPTAAPSVIPSVTPTQLPSTQLPSAEPSVVPSLAPSTVIPSLLPTTQSPSAAPSTVDFYLSHPKASLPSNDSISVLGMSDQPFRIIIPFFDINSGSNGVVFDNVVLGKGTSGSVSLIPGSTLPVSVSVNDGSINTYGNAVGFDSAMRSVSMLKDVNGDGHNDLIIGDPYVARCYILYGTKLGLRNMTTGFTIFGEAEGDLTGWSVSDAGDVNNDTIHDILIGAPFTKRTGAFYVIYGKTFTFDVFLNNLTTSQGFAVYGAVNGDYLGISVSNAGDVNKDGADDVIAGAVLSLNYFSGAAYVIFGGRSLVSMTTSQITLQQGYKLYAIGYWYAGYSVSAAGDVNKDGFDDVIIGSSPQKSSFSPTAFLVYGASSVTGDVLLTSLTVSQGIKITGGGVFVGTVGYIDADGYSDVLVWSNYAMSSTVGVILFSNVHQLTMLTRRPTVYPTIRPTVGTRSPSIRPSAQPSVLPTLRPSVEPTETPPSAEPIVGSSSPSSFPSSRPSIVTNEPSLAPSESPTVQPSMEPSELPSIQPTVEPSETPSQMPTQEPSEQPSSLAPVEILTRRPVGVPSVSPTLLPPSLNFNILTGNQFINSTQGAVVPVFYHCNASGLISIQASSSVGVSYTLTPRPDMEVVLWTFNVSVDLIDLTAFNSIKAFSDFKITAGSAIVNLPDGQLIRIMNHQPQDITASNFVIGYFNGKRDNRATDFILKMIEIIIPVGFVLLIAFCMISFYFWVREKVTVNVAVRRHIMNYSMNFEGEYVVDDIESNANNGKRKLDESLSDFSISSESKVEDAVGTEIENNQNSKEEERSLSSFEVSELSDFENANSQDIPSPQLSVLSTNSEIAIEHHVSPAESSDSDSRSY